ncbi:MAG: NADH-quinone oxidoreductase subunit J [Armatimonadota bacterium]
MPPEPVQPEPVVQLVTFYALAAVTIVSALGVVRLRSIVRSAMCLLPCFVGVAGLYLLLHAEFVFAMQLLVYAGGIMVLILFAIMLLQRAAGEELRHHNERVGLSFLVALAFLVIFGLVVVAGQWQTRPELELPAQGTIAWIGAQFLSRYIVPFEVISVVLLVAMVGAIIIARARRHEQSL